MQLSYNRQGFPQIFWNIFKPDPFFLIAVYQIA